MGDPWTDMYNFLQGPYRARQEAGQVVTPGPVDWGGIVQGLNEPYQRRVDAGKVVTPGPVDWGGIGNALNPRVDQSLIRKYGVQEDLSGFGIDPKAARIGVYKPVAPVNDDPMWVNRNLQGVAPPTQEQQQAMRAVPPAGKTGTQYFPPGPAYGYNSSTQNYEVKAPGNAYSSVPAPKFPAKPNTAVAAINTAVPKLPLGMQLNAGSRDSVANRTAGRIAATGIGAPRSLETPIQLQFEISSDVGGQNMADSAGRPIVTPSGKTFTPRQGNGNARTLPQVAPSDMRAPQRQGGGLFGGSGILASLFGGGGGPQAQAPRSTSGAPIAAPGVVIGNAVYGSGGSDYGSSPGQTTAGLKPGDRTYNADTNSWGLKR